MTRTPQYSVLSGEQLIEIPSSARGSHHEAARPREGKPGREAARAAQISGAKHGDESRLLIQSKIPQFYANTKTVWIRLLSSPLQKAVAVRAPLSPISPLPAGLPEENMASSSPSLPNISSLSSLDESSLTGILDLLFEPSGDLHALAVPQIRSTPFTSYSELIDSLQDKLLTLQKAAQADSAAREPLLAILGAHPRLGEKKVDSAQSAAEQAKLQAAEGSGEAEALAALNEQYEASFPGLRYVVFVNGRGRDVIMENMKERIARDEIATEEVEAIQVRPPWLCALAPRLTLEAGHVRYRQGQSRQASTEFVAGFAPNQSMVVELALQADSRLLSWCLTVLSARRSKPSPSTCTVSRSSTFDDTCALNNLSPAIWARRFNGAFSARKRISLALMFGRNRAIADRQPRTSRQDPSPATDS